VPTIDNPDEARNVARLIQSGSITGPARDSAMQALKDFDKAQSAPPFSLDTLMSRLAGGVQNAVAPGIGLGEAALHSITGTSALVPGAAQSVVGMINNGSGGMKKTAHDTNTLMDRLTYSPRTQGGQDLVAAMGLPGQAVDALAQARAQGPLTAQVGDRQVDPAALARAGAMIPAGTETPEQSKAMGLAVELAGNVIAPSLVGGATAPKATMGLPLLNKPSGLLDVLRGNMDAIRGNYVRSIAGNPDTRAALAQSLESHGAVVPHYQPTAAEVVGDQWQGTPIQALQQQTASSPVQLPNGGPAISQAFNQRLAQQGGALAAMKELRDNVTAGMREKALEGANATGGPMVGTPEQIANTMLNTPGMRASDVVTKAIGTAKNKLEALQDDTGHIDARDLYTVRKDMGKYIEDAAGAPGAKYDRKLASGLQGDLQSAFDDAIERAGGQGWKAYLNTYSRLSQKMQDALDSQESQYKPAQATMLNGPNAATAAAQTHIPHVLTRSGTLANWLLNNVRSGVQQKVTSSLGDALLNPQNGVLAADLRKGIRPEDMMQTNLMKQRLAAALASGSIGSAMAQGASQ
jgi:hypothetical protein